MHRPPRWSAGEAQGPPLVDQRAPKRQPLVTGTCRGARRASVNRPLRDASSASRRLPRRSIPLSIGRRKSGNGPARAPESKVPGKRSVG